MGFDDGVVHGVGAGQSAALGGRGEDERGGADQDVVEVTHRDVGKESLLQGLRECHLQ